MTCLREHSGCLPGTYGTKKAPPVYYAGEAFILQRSRSDPDEKLIDALKLTLHQMSSFKAFLPFQGKESLQPV